MGKRKLYLAGICLLCFLCLSGPALTQEYGNVNADGSVNIVDTLMIARDYKGLITVFSASSGPGNPGSRP